MGYTAITLSDKHMGGVFLPPRERKTRSAVIRNMNMKDDITRIVSYIIEDIECMSGLHPDVDVKFNYHEAQ